jgi:hypothetical protein
LHPGQVEGLTRQELAQRLAFVGRVVAAADLQAERRVFEAREELPKRGARFEDLTQLSSCWYLWA